MKGIGTTWIVAGLALCAGAALAQEAGVTIRAVALMQAPYSDAAQLAELPQQSAVTVLARQGAWMQVQAGEQTGWLRLLAVRLGGSMRAQGDSGVGKAVNVALSGSSGTAVATGVRGLDREQIANATPDLAAVDGLEGYAASEADARALAAEAPALSAQRVKELKR
jgi:hypothetical protein